jgi:aminoglycoside/choline kinase family phosphotransferase
MHTLKLLKHWLCEQLFVENTGLISLAPLKGDASFRRYYRVNFKNITYIAVYSPPSTEDNAGFIKISQAFLDIHLHVPKVYAYDLEKGFMLLSDFGDNLLYQSLSQNQIDHSPFFHRSLHELSKIQQSRLSLNHFDANFMQKECENFKIWFLDKHLNLSSTSYEEILDPVIHLLLQSAVSQPQCVIHRDYHTKNLMILNENKIGILDFQDAMIGPITYDLVSLLRDCYFALPADKVQELSLLYYEKFLRNIISHSTDFSRYFDLMGIQRHLKACFIFARKFHRDGVNDYLADIPRTLNYVVSVSAHYPELKAFQQFIRECIAQLPPITTTKGFT